MDSAERLNLKRLAAPLRLLFWGGLFIVVDFRLGLRVGNQAAGFDVLPDPIGLALVVLGVWRLAIVGRFQGVADLCVTTAATVFTFFFAGSVAAWFVPRLEDLAPWGWFALDAAAIVAIVALVFALYERSRSLGLHRLATEWAAIGGLFVVLAALPQLVARLRPELIEGTYSVPVSLLAVIPLIWMFAATNRMRKMAEVAVADPPVNRGAA